jgi:hypothetical protein
MLYEIVINDIGVLLSVVIKESGPRGPGLGFTHRGMINLSSHVVGRLE